MNKLFLLLMSVVLVMALVSCAGDPVTIPLDGGSTVGAVTGKILNKSGVGVEGVKITIGDVSVLTDSSGKFSAENIPSGKCTVTPTKNGYYFMPSTQDLSVSGSMMMSMKYDFITDTSSFGNSGHGGTRGYCAQCHKG